MIPSDEFINPQLRGDNLDRAIIRKAIYTALVEALPELEGTLLDIGCGRQPYRKLLTAPPSRVAQYIGMDLPHNDYIEAPEVVWDGVTIPLDPCSVDCAIATEVFEHSPNIEAALAEVNRVLRPGGKLFLTVPFLWPLHDVPYDEYRYTPFSLRRHLKAVGFAVRYIRPHPGWHGSLAVMLGLWVKRAPISSSRRRLFTRLLTPVIKRLAARDVPPKEFTKSVMITGLSALAVKGGEKS